MDKELLICRIDSLLEHIDLIFKDTNGLSISDIEKSNLFFCCSNRRNDESIRKRIVY